MRLQIFMALVLSAMPLLGQEPKAFALSPAAEPVPAMKYRLLPELRDQTPGNAITGYYRAFSPEWQSYRNDKQWSAAMERAMALSLAELRTSAEAKSLAWVRTSGMLHEVDRAARRSYCDWELKDRINLEGVGLLLPDVQALRSFAWLLGLRARLEMADGDFVAAAKTLQTGYALARHTAEGPTLIHGLVAIAIAASMNEQVDAWVLTPGSPNLYWALTDLPTPFIELRKGLQGERIFIDAILPQMRERLVDRSLPPLSAEQCRGLMAKFAGLSGQPAGQTEVLTLGLATVKYAGAKAFLAEQGWTAEQIDAMPAVQAVLMREVHDYDRLYDAVTKAANLPYHQGRAALVKGQAEYQQSLTGPLLSVPVLARLMLPAILQVTAARTRLDRKLAALRTVEAIRLYAAAHAGQLPPNLEALAVPVPLDPATGKSFDYALTGDTATLVGLVPPGESPSFGLKYELTIRK